MNVKTLKWDVNIKMGRVTEFAKQIRKPKSEGDTFPENAISWNIPVIPALSRSYTVPCPVPFTDKQTAGGR
jgi:hypothetical protein